MPISMAGYLMSLFGYPPKQLGVLLRHKPQYKKSCFYVVLVKQFQIHINILFHCGALQSAVVKQAVFIVGMKPVFCINCKDIFDFR